MVTGAPADAGTRTGSNPARDAGGPPAFPHPGWRVDEVLVQTRRRLEAAGTASPALDARLLLCAASGLTHERLIGEPERTLAAAERERLERLVRRRVAREPVSRIVGEREFWGRRFSLTPATLDPRPDTETLVAAALECAARLEGRAPSIADLGTGTGCVLISLLCELGSGYGIGIDIDPAAVTVAAANAQRHLDHDDTGDAGGVPAFPRPARAENRAAFVCGDWLEAIGGKFDLIVANPPYIPSAEIDRLEPEVARFEPRLALDGGADGLDAYRRIGAAAPDRLARGGFLVVEVGEEQCDAVAAIFARCGLAVAGSLCDLGGTRRCIFATQGG